MKATDTIYALASGAGISALSVIRISGSMATALVETITGDLPSPRRAALRSIRDPESGSILDEAVVIWMPAPRSFTGEDCAELHVHGSQAVQMAMFTLLSRFPGVRLAEAGEFTRRAVVNGKLDLVQAEGLGDLLAARTEAQRSQAVSHMLGEASSIFDSWRERLLLIRADLEAALDFSDEAGVTEEASLRVDGAIRSLLAEQVNAVAKARAAEAIRNGVRVVLAGLPNTGKSSLLNAIAGREAAIVSAVPGTTRDVIEVFLDMDGIPVILCDTAGLRDVTSDSIEVEGIKRTHGELKKADIVAWVMSADVSGSERYDLESDPDIIVSNKNDLRRQASSLLRNDLSSNKTVFVSAKNGRGLEDLLDILKKLIHVKFRGQESAVVVTWRQKSATLDSIRNLNESLKLSIESFELKAEHIRRAADAVGRITGRTEVEEWLGAIFSRFCIGK